MLQGDQLVLDWDGVLLLADQLDALALVVQLLHAAALLLDILLKFYCKLILHGKPYIENGMCVELLLQRFRQP